MHLQLSIGAISVTIRFIFVGTVAAVKKVVSQVMQLLPRTDKRRTLARRVVELDPVTDSRVVLTVAHLDHDTGNNDPGNLRAMCQRCHLTYDAKLHAAHAAQTRRRRQVDAGQLELFT